MFCSDERGRSISRTGGSLESSLARYRIERHTAICARWKALVLVAGVLFGSDVALSQDIKVQSREVQIRHYEMPLVLEISLAKLFPLPVGEAWTTTEMKYIRCRGIGLEELTFSLQDEKKGLPTVLAISTRVSNETRHDKRVTVLTEALADGKVIGGHALGGQVEQDDYLMLAGRIPLQPADRWSKEPRPTLRLTLTIADY